MALMLPLLLLILFGIIDLGYYVYGYATIYQAARNGTEKASDLPPYPNKLSNTSDDCTNAILRATETGAVLFPDIANFVQISYPSGQRQLGQPIQVEITYNIQPLTPLFRFVGFGSQGVMTVHVQARRSIESLGDNPNYANGVACQP
jgi:TadE-like protein